MSHRVLLTITGIYAYSLDGEDYVAGTVQKDGFPDRNVSVRAEPRWLKLGGLDTDYLGEIGEALERVCENISDLRIYTNV